MTMDKAAKGMPMDTDMAAATAMTKFTGMVKAMSLWLGLDDYDWLNGCDTMATALWQWLYS